MRVDRLFRRANRWILLGCAVLIALGCSKSDQGSRNHQRDMPAESGSPVAEYAVPPVQRTPGSKSVLQFAQAGGQAAEPPAAARSERKIIYTADVALLVKDFSDIQQRIPELVRRLDGYVADLQVHQTEGQRRSGKWVVRVPVERFEELLEAVAELGFPETVRQQAQDVTEEFFDLEARITSKREVERRLIKLLEERTGKIEDVVTVEKELGRVREEIERLEGRQRFLANRTALSTVTINAREGEEYVPPRAPTFTNRIAQSWDSSLTALVDSGQLLVVLVVGVAPWLPVLLVMIAVPMLLQRRSRRRGASS